CRRRRGRGPSGRRRAGRADGSGAPCEPTGPDLGHTGGMARTPDRGEAALLASMLPHLRHGPEAEVGPGDDAAVVRLPSPRLVVTTDTPVEGRVALGPATAARWTGRKAAVQDLADVAAMGAAPLALVVAMSAPADSPGGVFEELTLGPTARAEADGASIVGGDLGRAE